MLGLNRMESFVSMRMMTTLSALPGFELIKVLGLVEGVAEESFPAVGVGNFAVSKGGGLDRVVESAKSQLARAAGDMGANAVLAIRYEVIGRSVEKSVVIYGTAVVCKVAN